MNMNEDLLTLGEMKRLQGEQESAITAFLTVTTQTTTDINTHTSALQLYYNPNSNSTTNKVSKLTNKQVTNLESTLSHLKRIRALSTYQLSLLLLQNQATKYNTLEYKEYAEGGLWRLGFKCRLCDLVLGFDLDHFNERRRVLVNDDEEEEEEEEEVPVVVFDSCLPHDLFTNLQKGFDIDSTFWTQHQYPTQTFFSYNIPFVPPTTITKTKATKKNAKKSKVKQETLLEQVLSSLYPLLLPAFPELVNTESCEIWAHTRPGDSHHQLHYDLDEIALRSTGRVSCPLVSTVVYLDVLGEEAAGAPTLVCGRSILDGCGDEDGDEDEGEVEGDENKEIEEDLKGWLCYPKINRMLAFEGSLLHCVAPGIVPPPSSTATTQTSQEKRRVTMMIGWWPSNVTTSDFDLVDIGPNMKYPKEEGTAWFDSFVPVSVPSTSSDVEYKEFTQSEMALECIPSVFVPIPGSLAPHCTITSSSSSSSSIEDAQEEEDDDDEEEEEREEYSTLYKSKYGEYNSEDVTFTGRFFLRGNGVGEIDEEVLEGADDGGEGGDGYSDDEDGSEVVQSKKKVEYLSADDVLRQQGEAKEGKKKKKNKNKETEMKKEIEYLSVEDILKQQAEAKAGKGKGTKAEETKAKTDEIEYFDVEEILRQQALAKTKVKAKAKAKGEKEEKGVNPAKRPKR